MRKKRVYETTCRCTAYKFPHRFGGGRCTGRWIAKSTWNDSFGAGECQNCISNNQTEEIPYCEVVEGQAEASMCPKWQEFVEYNEIRLYK